MSKRLKLFDAVFILIFMLAVFLSFFVLKREKKAAASLLVQSPGEQFVYSLGRDGTYEFQGLLGKTVVQIKDGKACVTDSPCKNRLCIQAGAIFENGQWAACLPNGIFLCIEGGEPRSEFDAAGK